MEDLGSVKAEEREQIESLVEVYKKACGNLGLETFEEVVLPTLFKYYGSDYEVLQEEVKKIIKDAVLYDVREINNFLEKRAKTFGYKGR